VLHRLFPTIVYRDLTPFHEKSIKRENTSQWGSGSLLSFRYLDILACRLRMWQGMLALAGTALSAAAVLRCFL
jgi:hypothetical protein